MPCRNWIEQGFRGLKTVGDPCMVGEGSSLWLVLALATLLAVAYGTRREEAEARHLAPGHLRRPPAELDAAHQTALSPRHRLLQQGVALLRRLLLRGYLWACVGCDLRPAPTSARACAGWTPAAPEPTRAVGAGPRIALLHRSPSTLLPPRTSAQLGPPHRPCRPHGALLPLKLLVTVAPATFGPATHRSGPPIRLPPPIPAQKIPLSRGALGAWTRQQGPLHRVSAWETAHRPVLAQQAVDTKSNEFPAPPCCRDWPCLVAS